MAGYFINEMKVYGKRKDLESFKDEVILDKNWGLIFDNLIPMPEDFSAWDKDGKGEGWYYWQKEHWGVKWGERYTFVADMNKYLAYLFDTPWGPPVPIFETLVERYPLLNFEIITYDIEDYMMLEMKSKKGKLTIFSRFDCKEKRPKKKTSGYDYIEHDYLKNTIKLLEGPRIRKYDPLK